MPDNMNAPIALNFLFLPFVPQEIGTLLDPDGKPVSTDYENVKWRELSEALNKQIGEVAPKSIKAYTGNDAFDVFDLNGLDVFGETVENDLGVVRKAQRAIQNTGLKDRRGGILNLSEEDIHVNAGLDKRPPATSFIVSLKFPNTMSLADYSATVLSKLFEINVTRFFKSELYLVELTDPVMMNPSMREWLAEAFGAVYDPRCGVINLGITR